MTTRRIGRRMFLVGAGGFTLAVPFLPSLTRRGEAQTMGAPKRFVALTTEHGGVHTAHMWPDESLADQPTTVMGQHTIHHGALRPTMDSGDVVLSDVLRASSALLGPSVLSKMNLLRGLDVPWYCAHGSHMLGSYGPGSLAGDEGAPETPSIDQIMAYSSSVYETVPRRRSLGIGPSGLSTNWASPETRSGAIETVPTTRGTRALFDQIYVPTTPGPAPRAPVVDRVLESYNRVRGGAHGPGARLSTHDRDRLDDYMERLRGIQASMTATVAASCADVTVPTEQWDSTDAVYGPHANDPGTYGRFYQLYNDVIVAAFMCDSSRIATMRCVDDFHGSMDSVGGFHEVAHTANAQPEREAMLQVTNRNFFQTVYLDLVNKLDSVPDVGGTTILDNSLVMLTSESGPDTHINDSQPVVMAGSAGGALRTGLYVDYRDRTLEFRGPQYAANGRRPGLHYYGWLATCLDAMGVPRDEWPNGAGQPYTGRAAIPGWLETAHPRLDQIEAFSTSSLPVITV